MGTRDGIGRRASRYRPDVYPIRRFVVHLLVAATQTDSTPNFLVPSVISISILMCDTIMMDIWQNAGVDRSNFQSLAILLSLRNGGQLAYPDPSDEAAETESVTSVDTCANNLLSGEDHDAVQKRFLDRLAELFAREKDYKYVVATALIERPSDEGIIIYMARNHGFHKNGVLLEDERKLIRTIEETLSKTSQQASGELETNDRQSTYVDHDQMPQCSELDYGRKWYNTIVPGSCIATFANSRSHSNQLRKCFEGLGWTARPPQRMARQT